MKLAVCIFHKNIYAINKPEWVQYCINSIFNQTIKRFTVLELNYGEDNTQLYSGSFYMQKPLENHVQAQNMLFDYAALHFDVIFNVNLDDFYLPNRIEKQLISIKAGNSIVSSNFSLMNENSEVFQDLIFHKKNIAAEFSKNHNIIAHPVVAFTKDFWIKNRYYNEVDYHTARNEDFMLWKKAFANNEKFCILPEILMHYRIHNYQTGRTKNN